MTEPRFALSSALLLACAVGCQAAWAQAPQPSVAASAAERAQKETDRTMYWIRVLADKPAVARAAAPAPAPKPPAAVAAAPSAKPAAEPREKVRVAAAASPSATGTATDAAGVAPTPGPVARGSKVAHARIGDVSEPSALSSGSADDLAAGLGTPVPLPGPDLAPAVAAEPDAGLVQVKSVQPDFPRTTLLRVRKGNVEVKFEVEPGGSVVEADVVESSNARLNDAALEAVKQWRFKPGPKSHTALVNLVFNIDTEK